MEAFHISSSGRYSLAISSTWDTGMNDVQRKISALEAFLKKEESQSTCRLEKVKGLAEKQLGIIANNLSLMKQFKVQVRACNKDLAKQVTPHIQRAEMLKSSLETLIKTITARI